MVRDVQQPARVPPAVRADPTDDAAFDELLPRALQAKASVHFTPVAVARFAARLLAPEPGMSILDVGAGVGKFCITAALALPGAHFVGVERRPHLVQIAHRLARRWAVPNVRFVHGDAFSLDWSLYDAFYLFNPFAEHMFGDAMAIDETFELEPGAYILHVMAVRQRLSQARLGARLVTYHGFGAPPPPEYDLAGASSVGSDRVELWIKTRELARERDAGESLA